MKKSFLFVALLVLFTLVSCKTLFTTDVFVLSLEENPTTGYRWEVCTDEQVIKVIDDEYETKAKANLVGVGGTRTFTFEVLKPEESEIKLYYRRSWEAFPENPDIIYRYNPETDTLEQLI